jgi:hypothetical protein
VGDRATHSDKRRLEEAAGVPDYLIVYPEKRAERLKLGPERSYQTSAPTEWYGLLTLQGRKASVDLARRPGGAFMSALGGCMATSAKPSWVRESNRQLEITSGP